MEEKAGFFVSWLRWQRQDGYSLWIEWPEREQYWADARGNVPLFATSEEVGLLATKLGVQIYVQAAEPGMIDLDCVWQWLQQPQKRPPKECLAIWNTFSDVGSGVSVPFDGDRKSTVRNRVFDKLYFNDGIFQINQDGKADFHGPHTKPWIPGWKREERKKLQRSLKQGFRLWQKHTYRATIDAVPLP
ncbi:hypothetical protein CDA63_03840 [Hymenobacter amundsenii]|uniref:Uncharacterized protein n=1 Tax=Hymenobacter amundsenii TaxID=2006685 RepID=A0A246FP62_9BACT|nr:hypothetical protein [Hymenobacter amundsenii]OWP64510.1 hypothetical protein CDA63_03840 [Hymenobacter amundsenii]